MDEPASPLDPLMRDRLCDLIREYLLEEEGKRTVFFSTHNIADMENVTDYAIFMSHGQIEEAGFLEDLNEISVETASLSQISVAIMKHFASNAK